MQTQSSQETELGLLAHCQRWYPISIHYFCASPLFPWPWILQLDEWGHLPNSTFQDGGKLHFRLQSRALQVLFPLHPLATFFLWHFASTVSFPSSGVHQWHSVQIATTTSQSSSPTLMTCLSPFQVNSPLPPEEFFKSPSHVGGYRLKHLRDFSSWTPRGSWASPEPFFPTASMLSTGFPKVQVLWVQQWTWQTQTSTLTELLSFPPVSKAGTPPFPMPGFSHPHNFAPFATGCCPLLSTNPNMTTSFKDQLSQEVLPQ